MDPACGRGPGKRWEACIEQTPVGEVEPGGWMGVPSSFGCVHLPSDWLVNRLPLMEMGVVKLRTVPN